MAHTSISPRELVDQAVGGKFDIPEFQRGFVWSPEKVKNLLDSLCRDYPLGAVLCWRSQGYTSARTASASEAERLWIVDGQQRTTALCLLLGKKPFWFPSPEPWNAHYRKCDVQVNLLSDATEIELSLPNPVIAKSNHWASARELFSVAPDQIPAKAMDLIRKLGKPLDDTAELGRLMGIINTLQAVHRREVVMITIDHDPVDVAEIFSRLNSAGTRVNEGDIALALIAVRQEGWVREQLLPYLHDLEERGFGFDPSFMIRSMVAIRRGGSRLRDVPRDFWEANEQFTDGWVRTKSAVNNVVRVLRELGVLSVDILPARNALIPLFALDDLYFKGDANRLRKAFLWLLCAIRGGRYSSAATTTIAQDLTAIRNAAGTDSAVTALYAPLEANLEFTADQLLRRYDEEPFLRLMLYLVAFNAGAEDWKTGQRLGFDRSDNCLNEGFRPEWHHFVPRGRLQRRESPPPDELINCLANIVVLSEGDNRRFSYSEPYKYLEKYQIPDDRVYQQFFPERELWCAEHFEDFAQARSKLLAQEMNAYVAQLGEGAWAAGS